MHEKGGSERLAFPFKMLLFASSESIDLGVFRSPTSLFSNGVFATCLNYICTSRDGIQCHGGISV